MRIDRSTNTRQPSFALEGPGWDDDMMGGLQNQRPSWIRKFFLVCREFSPWMVVKDDLGSYVSIDVVTDHIRAC